MYVYSLTQCLSDAHELEKSVEKLRNERRRLIQQIRLASVGLTKVDGVIIVDTKVVKSTDEAVKNVLGEELGLDIALFLEMLKRNPDGKSM
jgi:histidinol-phosphate/aromatic aminotransferase/cobyric acid decarboxylase-like protein